MNYESHDYANLFPLMLDNEYKELKNDIKVNGLIEPIWLFEGKILDGRNRYSACLDTNTEPKFRDYQSDDPLGFVVSLNLNRRHLTSGQKATLAVELLPLLEAEAKKRQAKKEKWLSSARADFKELLKIKSPCVICGKHLAIVEAHHVYPLAMQYDDKVKNPIRDFVWLCPTHHVITHEFISILIKKGINYSDFDLTPYEMDDIMNICEKTMKLRLSHLGAIA